MAVEVGGPGTSTSTTANSGATVATTSAIPGVRTTRSTPRPSAVAPPDTGGRLGPLRTVSSRERSTSTGLPCWSASRRAVAGAPEAAFPPKAPPFASGPAGSPPGSHQAASVSRYAGSTHGVRSTASQSPGGASSGGRASTVVRRPCTFPAAERASARVSATAQPPELSGTATRHPVGAVSAANPPPPSTTCGPTAGGVRPSRVARAAARVGSVAGRPVP